jgi:hypothetical protein
MVPCEQLPEPQLPTLVCTAAVQLAVPHVPPLGYVQPPPLSHADAPHAPVRHIDVQQLPVPLGPQNALAHSALALQLLPGGAPVSHVLEDSAQAKPGAHWLSEVHDVAHALPEHT